MIRIEELDNGVLAVINDHATRYTTTLDDLPPELSERYEILRATDVGTVIEGVGRHVSVRTFWIYEDTDGENGTLSFRKAERNFVNKLSTKFTMKFRELLLISEHYEP